MFQQLINERREKFIEKLIGGHKGDCPYCGRYAQIYKRGLHHSVARQLILLHKLQGDSFEYVHSSRLIPDGTAGVGDLTKARYWGLIQKSARDSYKKRSSGSWRLTVKGNLFVEQNLLIEKYVTVFDDRVLSRSSKMVSISDCLKNGGFDYYELMRG